MSATIAAGSAAAGDGARFVILGDHNADPLFKPDGTFPFPSSDHLLACVDAELDASAPSAPPGRTGRPVRRHGDHQPSFGRPVNLSVTPLCYKIARTINQGSDKSNAKQNNVLHRHQPGKLKQRDIIYIFRQHARLIGIKTAPRIRKLDAILNQKGEKE